jgi:ERCC4-type nuclease
MSKSRINSTISIDSREKDPMLCDAVISLAQDAGYTYAIETLPVGDFLWRDADIIIEHKSTKDFLQSLISGHLHSQLRDMAQFTHPYLFIEGEWNYTQLIGKTRLTQKMVAGMMSGIMYHFPYVQVVYWPSDIMFAQAVVSLRNRADEKGPLVDIAKRVPSKTMYEDPNLSIFMSVPGIGEKKARDLIETYRNFYWFVESFRNDPAIFRMKGQTIPKRAFAYMEGITKD